MSLMDHLARLGVVLGGLDGKDNLLTFAVHTNSTLLAETNALRTIQSYATQKDYE